MKIFFIYLSLTFFYSSIVFGQPDQSALLEQLQKSKQDTTKVNLLLSLGETEIDNPKSFKKHLQESFVLSRNLNFKNGLHKYYSLMTKFYMFQNKPDSCIYFAKKGIANAKTISLDKLAQSYSNLGAAYSIKGYTDSTSIALLKALEIQEKLAPNLYRLTSIYLNLSAASYRVDDFKNVINYSRKSVFYATKNPKHTFLAEAHINLGLGFAYTKELDSADFHYNKALKMAYKNQNIIQQLYTLENIVDLYHIKRNYPKMLETAKLFQKISTANPQYVTEKIKSDLLLSKANLLNDNILFAKKHGEMCIKNAKKEDSDAEIVKKIHYLMYEIETRQGNFSKAEDYYVVYDSINTAFKGQETQNNINLLNTKYNVAKKDAALQFQKVALERNRIIILLLSTGLIFLAILGWLVFKARARKQKIMNQANQIDASKLVIKIQEDERTRIAKDLHDGLGSLLSGVKHSLQGLKNNINLESNHAKTFDQSLFVLDQGIKDLRSIAHDMIPQNLINFGLKLALDDFCKQINASTEISVYFNPINLDDYHKDVTYSITIYRIVQELIHNVMKHAFAKNLIVQLSVYDKKLNITIEDDGKGFDTTLLEVASGMGLSNVKNRVLVLEGILQITSNKQGTTVNIDFPL